MKVACSLLRSKTFRCRECAASRGITRPDVACSRRALHLAFAPGRSAAQGALRSLARTLSGELIARGVRVNTLSPGPGATPIYGKLGLPSEDLEQMSRALLAQLPAGRFGDPVEIAQAAVFLASDESAYAIGSELVVDGGLTTV